MNQIDRRIQQSFSELMKLNGFYHIPSGMRTARFQFAFSQAIWVSTNVTIQVVPVATDYFTFRITCWRRCFNILWRTEVAEPLFPCCPSLRCDSEGDESGSSARLVVYYPCVSTGALDYREHNYYFAAVIGKNTLGDT